MWHEYNASSNKGPFRLRPAGPVGRPEEIANAVLFLASDEARFVSGVELFVDGGQVQT
jgi:NAD(P)-dependent dehydrogenase (short-subunit alcohol dehydrogenase family)